MLRAGKLKIVSPHDKIYAGLAIFNCVVQYRQWVMCLICSLFT